MTTPAGGWTGKRKDRPKKPPATTKPRATPNKPKGKAGQPSHRVTRVRATSDKRLHGEGGRYVSKLTPEVIEKLEQALGSGAPPADAAPMAGISRRTFQEWMSLASLPDAPPLLVDLAQAVDRALSSYHVAVGASVTKAAREGDVKAQTFILERRFPGAWGQRNRVEIGNADGEPFKVMVEMFDAAQLPGASLDEIEILRRAFAILQRLEQSNVIELATRKAIGQ